MTKKPNRIISLLNYKCPRCRQGDMYVQKNLWPLPTMMQMPTHCKVCGQKTELESGFYFGTGYVSYALSVAFLVAFFVAYHVIIGLSIERNTVIPCLIAAVVLLILIQPWMMRLSRILYLSAFVGYDADWEKK
jgi:flagellar biosynthesis protein FliQ